MSLTNAKGYRFTQPDPVVLHDESPADGLLFLQRQKEQRVIAFFEAVEDQMPEHRLNARKYLEAFEMLLDDGNLLTQFIHAEDFDRDIFVHHLNRFTHRMTQQMEEKSR